MKVMKTSRTKAILNAILNLVMPAKSNLLKILSVISPFPVDLHLPMWRNFVNIQTSKACNIALPRKLYKAMIALALT